MESDSVRVRDSRGATGSALWMLLSSSEGPGLWVVLAGGPLGSSAQQCEGEQG